MRSEGGVERHHLDVAGLGLRFNGVNVFVCVLKQMDDQNNMGVLAGIGVSYWRVGRSLAGGFFANAPSVLHRWQAPTSIHQAWAIIRAPYTTRATDVGEMDLNCQKLMSPQKVYYTNATCLQYLAFLAAFCSPLTSLILLGPPW